jgi:hypothetical protein
MQLQVNEWRCNLSGRLDDGFQPDRMQSLVDVMRREITTRAVERS